MNRSREVGLPRPPPPFLVGGGFELVGGHVAEGAVQAGAVVPGDVFHGGVAGGGPGGPGLLVEALAFQGGEERLGERVVPSLAGAACRQADHEIVGEGGVVAAGLATLVRMEHHPGRPAATASARRRPLVRAAVPGGDVDHGGQVRPAFPGRDVGNVATSAGVDRGGVDGESRRSASAGPRAYGRGYARSPRVPPTSSSSPGATGSTWPGWPPPPPTSVGWTNASASSTSASPRCWRAIAAP